MTRLIAFLFVLLLVALPASADLELPELTGRVVDLADILSAETEAALTERLAAHEERTTNQVVVATVPSLQGYDIERFANELFRAWGLGQKDRNNGVLLLVAPNERAVRIEVGYGLEGTLTDAVSADIIQNSILPDFRDGDLAGGVTKGAEGILAAIEGTYRPGHRSLYQRIRGWLDRDTLILTAFNIGFFLLVAFINLRRRRSGDLVTRQTLPSWSDGGSDSSGGFSGGGGSSGGGGASGRW